MVADPTAISNRGTNSSTPALDAGRRQMPSFDSLPISAAHSPRRNWIDTFDLEARPIDGLHLSGGPAPRANEEQGVSQVARAQSWKEKAVSLARKIGAPRRPLNPLCLTYLFVIVVRHIPTRRGKKAHVSIPDQWHTGPYQSSRFDDTHHFDNLVRPCRCKHEAPSSVHGQ